MLSPNFSFAKWSFLQTKRLHLMPTTKTEPAMQSQVSTPTFLSAKWSVLRIKRLHLNNHAWTSNTEHPCLLQPFHLQNGVFCRSKGCTSCQQPRLNLPCRVKCQPQPFYLQNGVICRSKGCTSTTKLEPPTQSTHADPNLFICKMECFADQKFAPHANNQDWTCHAESSVNPNLFSCKMECFADQKVAPQQPSLNLQHRAPMPTPTFSSAKWSILQTKRLHLMPTTKTEPVMQSQVSIPTFLSAKWSVLQIKRLHLNNQAWSCNTECPCQPQSFHLWNGMFCRPKGCTSCQQPRLNLPSRVKCQPWHFYLQNGVFCRSKGCTSMTKLEPPTQSTHANPNLSSAKWSVLQTKRLHLMPTTETEPAMQSQVSTPTFLSAKWNVSQIKRLHLNNQAWTSDTEHPCQSQPFHLPNQVFADQKVAPHANNQNWTCHAESSVNSNLFICKMECFADQKVAPQQPSLNLQHRALMPTPTFSSAKRSILQTKRFHLMPTTKSEPAMQSQVSTPTFLSAKWSVLQIKRLHLNNQAWTSNTEPPCQPQPFHLQNGVFCRPKGCTSCQQPRLNLPHRVKCQPQPFYLQNGVFRRSKGCTSTTKLEPPTQSTHANPNLFICKMEYFADQKVAPHANNQDWTCHAESSVNPNLFICKMECFADQKVAPQQPSLNLQHRAPMPTPTFSSAKWSVLQTKRLHLMPTTKTEPAMQSQVSTPTFLSAKWSVLQIKRLHLNNQAWTSNTEHPCQPQPFHLQNGVFCRPKGCTSCQQPRLNLPCRVKCQPQPFYLQNGVFCRSKGCTSTTKLEPPTQSTHANPNLFICKMECFADQKVAPHANNQD